MPGSLVELKKISYRYDSGSPFEKLALDDISLKLAKNQTLAIIGRTGSGKSTLVKHINGLLKPQRGQVLINGQDIWASGKLLSTVVFEVGLVFQYPENQLFASSVAEDVAYGPTNMGLDRYEVDRRVKKSLTEVGLSAEILSADPMRLSGGQMRRVALAGVMAMEPSVLVLDEPTAGLDPIGSRQIMDLIDDYRHREDHSAILVSHSMDDVLNYADKILVIDSGKTVLSGSKQAVFSAGNLSLLEKSSLDLPDMIKIAIELKKAGLNISDQSIISVKKMARDIVDNYQRLKNE